MAVYDRWHRDPRPGGEPCRCSRGKNPLYPSAAHLQGDRWQVRWYDDAGKQKKRNFALREGRDPSRHADAFWAKVSRDLDSGDYTDPDAALVTFREYAEQWRKARSRDEMGAANLEAAFRLHVYPVIGHLTLRKLSRTPSLTQAWIRGLRLGPVSARQLVTDVSGVYIAAMGDGLIGANPTRASSVARPVPPPRKARAWTGAQVHAVAAALPPRYRVVPVLGAGTGMRQGELFGLAPGDVAFLGREPKIAVQRQVKHVHGRMYFAPPKRRKARETPMDAEVSDALARHLRDFPAVAVTLPWWDPRDRQRHLKPVTVRLVITGAKGGAVDRRTFNGLYWHAALEEAGIVPRRPEGERRAPAREHGMHVLRHTYASAQLSAGTSVTDVAAWMGDTAAVVMGTYAHFMPGNEDRGRAAISAFFGRAGALNVPREGEAGALWLVNEGTRYYR